MSKPTMHDRIVSAIGALNLIGRDKMTQAEAHDYLLLAFETLEEVLRPDEQVRVAPSRKEARAALIAEAQRYVDVVEGTWRHVSMDIDQASPKFLTLRAAAHAYEEAMSR